MHISRIALAALTALSTAAAQEAIACNEVQIFLSRGHGEVRGAVPGSKLVISGWSRGGALVSDLLAGGGGIPLAGDLCEQPATPPLDPDVFPGNRVAAVLNFGVLHHNANQSWNVGSGSSRDGQHPRNEEMLRQLGRWADRFRDYCEANDPLCAQGGDPASHRDYFVKEKWRQMAAEFVASRLG
uniref:Uncharacterized protein n=1 Tax=Pyricularia oryzae (strain P131) TaxID=1143193 RepID=L7J3P0_PYRO1